MSALRAPGIGDTVDKWESWIERYIAYLMEKGEPVPIGVYKQFNTYKTNEIKGFGTNWDKAVKFGDDKKYLKIMENNWKYLAYIGLKGEKPKTFDLKRY